MTDAKVCRKCSQSKELSDFYKNKASKDGLRNACKECTSIQSRAYNASNKESIAATKKAYREANRDDLADYNKAWREAHPDHKAAINGRGSVEERGGAASEIYDVQLCIPFYEEARRLSKETGVPHHVDHIVPISRGGLHCQTNLQVLTAKENIQKGDK